ncbi:MAG: thioredoxin-disulfide reductase [Candidatus Parvarchaeota archaeon]|jgi:thioredoxin reductase (NADPH)|nr:thioredoxin-disulfide reductase [Candidatus Parvarchaeota archaeon]
MVEKVIIIGSGPAGYTAAIYAVRDGLDPLLMRGFEVGGQLMLTSQVENFPGFKSILGPDLMDKLAEQVSSLKCRVIDDNVSKVDLGSYPYRVYVNDKEYEAYSIIIATGASARWLGLENEKRLVGKGVSGCAICDGAFFKNKSVVVVGGGDSAMEDASYLATLTDSVTLIHRKHEFRASKIMQDRVLSNKKINIIWDSEVIDVLGKEHVEGVKIKNVKTGEEKEIKTDGFFLAIGHNPNTEIFKGQIAMDENGYIQTSEFTKTSKEGVFAAGDVQDKRYKQAVIAAGWGSMCAIDARKFLEEKKLN